MSRVVALSAILLTALLAGCSGEPETQGAPEPTPDAFDDVQVSSTTGAIRGVVVTEAVVPVVGVLITLTGGKNQTTDEQGAFVFNGLEPGDYFMEATKKGFLSQQASATVVAGDEEPPVTKITLLAKSSEQPYTTLQTWEGFMQCAVMAGDGFVGAQLCGFFDDRFIHYYGMDIIPEYAQAEAVWQSTQPAGGDLELSYYDGGTWHFKNTHGVSPLILNATHDDIVDWWTENATELPMRMFPGNGAVSLVVNQQFTVYMTMFYNFSPRQGWAFILDGPCDIPEACS